MKICRWLRLCISKVCTDVLSLTTRFSGESLGGLGPQGSFFFLHLFGPSSKKAIGSIWPRIFPGILQSLKPAPVARRRGRTSKGPDHLARQRMMAMEEILEDLPKIAWSRASAMRKGICSLGRDINCVWMSQTAEFPSVVLSHRVAPR